ncbi:MAG: hypothetical protein KC501_24835 [Myxococcales bacterium]|nr:hypothetical protein [Myxococcales bacterium]
MEGARRHDEPAPAGAPPPEVVHRIHDRYLIEVVEQLGLCPFARRSRELGRVHRPLLYGETPSPEQAAARLHALVQAHPDAEIVLLTFLHADPRPLWERARALDDFVKELRARYDATEGPLFFMVGFHPRSGEPEPGETPPRLTPDSLVVQLRRTPDPVIQCVRAEVLDRVRRQAQQAAHARALEEARLKYPQLVELLERSIQPDSSLSADIARKNFEGVATGEGRERLEAVLADIQRERDEAYAPWWQRD